MNGTLMEIKEMIKDIKLSEKVTDKVVASIVDSYIQYGTISEKQEDIISRYHYFHVEHLGNTEPITPTEGWITQEQINLIAPFSRKVQKFLLNYHKDKLPTQDDVNGYGIEIILYGFASIDSMFKFYKNSSVSDGKFYTHSRIPFRFKLR